MTAYADLHDDGERLSPDELAALQLKRLRATLHRVYDRVPFHRQAFDKAGVHPDDCRSLADLSLFPFTTKTDLREQYPFGMFAVPRPEVRRIHASSGTTGRPTVVGYTEETCPPGPTSSPGRCARRARGRARSCTWRTGTGCSPEAWAPTTARSGWAVRSCPPPGA